MWIGHFESHESSSSVMRPHFQVGVENVVLDVTVVWFDMTLGRWLGSHIGKSVTIVLKI